MIAPLVHAAAGKIVPSKSRKAKAQRQSSSADARKQASLDHAAAVVAAAAALPMLAPFVPRMLREKLAAAQLRSPDGTADVCCLLGRQCCSVQQHKLVVTLHDMLSTGLASSRLLSAGAKAHDGDLRGCSDGGRHLGFHATDGAAVAWLASCLWGRAADQVHEQLLLKGGCHPQASVSGTFCDNQIVQPGHCCISMLQVIDLIDTYGGDVMKFAGTATSAYHLW
jgi:hypothetical protein